MNTTGKNTHIKLYLLVWCSYTVMYITKYSYSICMSDMMASGLFEQSFGGIIGTAMLACYGFGQLLNGWLGDKISPKYMIGVGLLGTCVTDICMGCVNNKWLFLIFWGITGVFCSMLWAPVTRCMAEWLPDSFRPKASVWISATIPVGTIAAYGIGGLALKTISYKAVFFIASSCSLVMALIWFSAIAGMKGYIAKAEQALVKLDGKKSAGIERISIKKLVSLIFVTGTVVAAFSVIFNGVLKDGVTMWLPAYLADFFGISSSAASTLLMILPIINLAGAFTAVQLNVRAFKNEFTTTAVMFGAALSGILLLFFVGKYNAVFAVLFISIATSSMLGANTMLLTFIPMNFNKVGRTSTLTGFLDACSYLASAVSGITIGVISENSGWNATVLSWSAVAAIGLIVSAIGIPLWKNGKKQLQ